LLFKIVTKIGIAVFFPEMSKSHFDDHGFDEFDREPEILTEYYDDHYDLPRTINGPYISTILAVLLEEVIFN